MGQGGKRPGGRFLRRTSCNGPSAHPGLRAYDAERYSRLDGYADDVLEICHALDLRTIHPWSSLSPAVLFASVFLLAGIAAPAPAQDGTGTLRIRVESHGEPLVGAQVRDGRIAVLTDA